MMQTESDIFNVIPLWIAEELIQLRDIYRGLLHVM